MKNTLFAILLSPLPMLLSGCGGGWKTFQQGTYGGKRYELQSRSQSGLFSVTNSIDWRIRLGKLPAVPVNATVTDWGAPYSNDVFGSDAYLYLPGSDTTYHNVPETPGNIGVFHTMLYISPKTLSEEQFETFYQFMRAEWPRLRGSVVGREPRDFPDILGLVYGDREKYLQEFRGEHEGKPMVLSVEPDGRVRLEDEKVHSAESYSGLSQKVQMPGKRLMLDNNQQHGGLTPAGLHGFRNRYDAPVDSVFEIIAADVK